MKNQGDETTVVEGMMMTEVEGDDRPGALL